MTNPNEPATWNWLDNLPDELSLDDWAYVTQEDITSFQCCPFCTGLFWNPKVHIQRSKECMVALTDEVEEYRRNNSTPTKETGE